MLLITLYIALALLLLNYLPVWFLISSNRFSYFQSIFFGFFFIGIWGYKIASEIELQNAKEMDLKESVYHSTNRSKARMRRRYHDPWEYIYINMHKLENDMQNKREKSAWLLRILSVDAVIVFLMAMRGKKNYYKQQEYYSRNMRTYALFSVFCIFVEILNYYFFDI